MNVPFVDLLAQYHSIKQEIDAGIAAVIGETAFIGGSGNRYVEDFEKNFAKFIGAKHCVSCANGTDAIEILLQACGVKAGDEVIVPANSWISTSEAVSAIGATVVFADVLPLLNTIDPESIRKKITTKTKVIIPVHIYGLPAEMDEIMALAKQHNLIVIEDCAQSHGAKYKNKITGSIGHAASFSFYPGKNLGAYGDAGGVVTNDDNIAAKAMMITNHGQFSKHDHRMEGRNSRLDGIQAAVLSVKLKYIDQWNAMRRKNADHYLRLLGDKKGIVLPVVPSYSTHVFHLFVLEIGNRESVMNTLKKEGVHTAIHYPVALPFLPAYSRLNHDPQDFPVAYSRQGKIVSLPMYPELTEEMIGYVCARLLGLLSS